VNLEPRKLKFNTGLDGFCSIQSSMFNEKRVVVISNSRYNNARVGTTTSQAHNLILAARTVHEIQNPIFLHS
jgi:hypothetical protein